MIDKDTYKRELIRMWDSLRDDKYEGRSTCIGTRCKECPLGNTVCCEPINAFEVVKVVEKWAKENQPKKIQSF
ncbi:hypothetical protein [Sharpea azabuensis]|uniref:hypothetical protein n=1 Tax=Sharpea azabuensis TaxID=322505 RepID=UPI00240A08E0|nr:hypothetical protein [Sharpea azabuensis]MDD6512801.1 hypothetical protein [Sharpea azabuensis]